MCKLGVTYKHLSVDLLKEIVAVSTDLIQMYVASVPKINENENENLNLNNVEEGRERRIESETGNGKRKISDSTMSSQNDGNSRIGSGTSSRSIPISNCEINSIPLATLAAASLHWIALMKIPFIALQNDNKITILKYLDTVLFLSLIEGKSSISFPFLLSILTNLNILEIKWSDLTPEIKNKIQLFSRNIYNKNNINILKKCKKIEIERESKNTEMGFEICVLEEKCLLKANILRFENLLNKMNSPSFNELIEGKENYETKDEKLKISISNMIMNKNDVKEGNMKENKNGIKNENINEIAISKLLLKLSSKIVNLNDNDLLKVIFLLGHRKVPIHQLRQAHIPKFDPFMGENNVRGSVDRIEGVKNDRKEVEKDAEIDFETSNDVRGIKSSIKDVFEVEVKESNLSLLQVLDVQLYGMLTNLSPGEF